MNASYGSDGMNTEKFSNVKLKTKADTFMSHLTSNFMSDRQLNDNLYAVQCLDKNRFHFIEGDTDSMFFAVAADINQPINQG
ncbi:MAG: hypothetical protein EZS28_049372, partial [Streblomastix strix]